jgi:hypothetical protein
VGKASCLPAALPCFLTYPPCHLPEWKAPGPILLLALMSPRAGFLTPQVVPTRLLVRDECCGSRVDCRLSIHSLCGGLLSGCRVFGFLPAAVCMMQRDSLNGLLCVSCSTNMPAYLCAAHCLCRLMLLRLVASKYTCGSVVAAQHSCCPTCL